MTRFVAPCVLRLMGDRGTSSPHPAITIDDRTIPFIYPGRGLLTDFKWLVCLCAPFQFFYFLCDFLQGAMMGKRDNTVVENGL